MTVEVKICYGEQKGDVSFECEVRRLVNDILHTWYRGVMCAAAGLRDASGSGMPCWWSMRPHAAMIAAIVAAFLFSSAEGTCLGWVMVVVLVCF